jgi:hypothetical protein
MLLGRHRTLPSSRDEALMPPQLVALTRLEAELRLRERSAQAISRRASLAADNNGGGDVSEQATSRRAFLAAANNGGGSNPVTAAAVNDVVVLVAADKDAAMAVAAVTIAVEARVEKGVSGDLLCSESDDDVRDTDVTAAELSANHEGATDSTV